jgi:hypothetical protein
MRQAETGTQSVRQSATAMSGGPAEVDKRADTLVVDSAKSYENPIFRRGIPVLSYGIVMGLVTTSLGALVASGLAGRAQILVWVGVTGVLAVGAVGSADLAVDVVLKLLTRQERRNSGPGTSWGAPSASSPTDADR